MNKEILGEHYEKINAFFYRYNTGNSEVILNQCKEYILKDSDLKNFIFKKMGAPDATYYFGELFTHKYFLKDMPRISEYIRTEIDGLNSLR